MHSKWLYSLFLLLLCGFPANSQQPATGQQSILEQAANEVQQVVERCQNAIVTVRLQSAGGGKQSGNIGLLQNHRTGSSVLVSTGFIIDPSGYIVCSADGVSGKGPFRVALPDGQVMEALKIGADQITSVALLKVQVNEPLPALIMGNSDTVPIGSTGILIGNRHGLAGSVTVGTIGGKDRAGSRANSNRLVLLMQFNAPLGAGEPGSPLLNSRGEVIGMMAGALSEVEGVLTQHAATTGFAVPSNLVRRVVNDLRAYGRARHAWMGAVCRTFAQGLRVESIVPQSPAQLAGLQVNDILLQFNGTPLTSMTALTRSLFYSKPGDKVALIFVRDGKRMQATLTLGDQPE